MKPLCCGLSGCATWHVAASDRSRILQLSTYSRSPPHTYVTFSLMSCAAHADAANTLSRRMPNPFATSFGLPPSSPQKFQSFGPIAKPPDLRSMRSPNSLRRPSDDSLRICHIRTSSPSQRRESDLSPFDSSESSACSHATRPTASALFADEYPETQLLTAPPKSRSAAGTQSPKRSPSNNPIQTRRSEESCRTASVRGFFASPNSTT